VRRTATDLHWSDRAESVAADVEVNIMDVFQRELEYDHVCRYLEPHMRVLEVGCGNGFSTRRFRDFVAHIDAFDYSEEMVERAKRFVGDGNNRFFHDDVLHLRHADPPYDCVVCVRVLINLADMAEQLRALEVMTDVVAPGGRLILAEGFTDGFGGLDELRIAVGLPAITPAAINFYSSTTDVLSVLERAFDVEETFHLGAYDYLTRVFYPLLVGPEKAKHNTVFSEQASKLARHHNPTSFESLSRMRGFVLRKRG
jgi:SAM-dependent methyltransferase